MNGLVREGFRVARSQPTATVTTIVVAAAVSAAVVLTRGAAIQQQVELRDRLEDSGSRVVRVVDIAPTAQLDIGALERLRRLDGVQWVIALGETRDVSITTLPSGPLVSSRYVSGSAPGVSTRSVTESPCGAYVSAGAATVLGIDAPAGAVQLADGPEIPICGTFTAVGALDELAGSVLVREDGWTGPVRTFVIGVRDVVDVRSVADGARALSGADDEAAIRVEFADQLIEVQGDLERSTTRFGRSAVVTTIAGGAFVTALTAYLAVASRRRDFGRRRALGARRSQLFVVVVSQFAASAIVGSAVGSAAGAAVLAARFDDVPPMAFLAAVCVLTVAAGLVGAIAPAIVAANRDPLAVLRVP